MKNSLMLKKSMMLRIGEVLQARCAQRGASTRIDKVIYPREREKGFTLIELMITVAIIAIIMGFAMPAYLAHGVKAKRHQAMSSMTELVQAMEKDFTINESYRDIVSLNKFANQVPYSGTANYNLTVAIPLAGGYVISATPTGSHTDADCGVLTLSDTAAKTPLSCW